MNHLKMTILSIFIIPLLMTPLTTQARTEISMGRCKITAYCPCEICSDFYGRQTSTGNHARSGHTVAVDPSVIGYGAILMIDGHEYVAEDCGARVQGDHIDIFFDTHEEVKDFGTKYKNVWIVGWDRDK